LWRLAIATAAGSEPAWQLGLARAQAACGDATAAIVTTQDLLRQTPGFRPAMGFFCQMLVLQDRRATAIAELADGVFAGGLAPVSERLRLLLWLEHMDDARAVFERAFAVADKVEDFVALFPHIPRLYEPADRLRLWREVYHRVVDQPGPTAAFLAMRLALASRDYDAFLHLHDQRPMLPPPWQGLLARVADTLRRPGFPDMCAQKLFVIGLSKTATTSVHKALGQLGYLSAHFDNSFSHAMLTMADAALFDAMGDIPVSAQFETLYDAYPNARFIYTTRPMESWLPSFAGHYRRWHGSDDFGVLRAQCLRPERCRNGHGLAEIHHGLYFQYADASSAWLAHDARVAAFFADKPANKLLRLDLFSGHGWPEICAFLGVPAPKTPFPWENRSLVPA
ncbi:MAG TPA: sulfotransferase, partial [Acetobacteraceae bacterium]|nr:sulfotransferase [Acetobacteraceae bacterium]